MRAGVGTDIGSLPSRQRAILIVALERFAIIRALVTEDGAIGIELGRIPHQMIPVVVPGFMTEMADQRAVGFAHCLAVFFAGGIVSFSNIDGDQAMFVAGQHALGLAVSGQCVGLEFETQSGAGFFDQVANAEPEFLDRIEQPPLGLLERCPVPTVFVR